ncbi:hypothetical protein GCM10010277_84750 [Streptomyces longisporoflavus]|uniref:hypothetical protein n=1 Tax=Streptomyces longisporoflavus TaxID=28044 RepID=UPI00167DBFED|nr:hypothetical protein [Streptomyces longisporoflavus]GGV72164.1 hypothetical protein GCM10010277_84750 [Streptomyces longisporoflavus]
MPGSMRTRRRPWPRCTARAAEQRRSALVTPIAVSLLAHRAEFAVDSWLEETATVGGVGCMRVSGRARLAREEVVIRFCQLAQSSRLSLLSSAVVVSGA